MSKSSSIKSNGNISTSAVGRLDIDLTQAFAYSVPTDKRLRLLLNCMVSGADDPDNYSTPRGVPRNYRMASLPSHRFYLGDLVWEFNNPNLIDYQTHESRRSRRHALAAEWIRTEWPASLGKLVCQDGFPQSFEWNAGILELVCGAFYSRMHAGECRRTIVTGGKSPMIENPCQGRIWMVRVPTGFMPFSAVAFVANYTQTAGLFEPELAQMDYEHPYVDGLHFVN
ncbi:hypothetical protein B0I35DRAFT_514070 [Stachybotrys elegans]|uniref:Uncharacterized protein n=1 Tax=Stachybotrys elegans TaxID=80388 RepID=A0A8K0WMV5_9HYPO|nr:hypothetical protein B0I35DRAFT_514070 [Stachybotrys elegans]